jgi:hypothetical protein
MRVTLRPVLPFLSALGLVSSALPATALDVSDFYESCFIRSYDAAHLAKHPGQRVSAVQAEIIEWEANPFVRITYAVKGGANYRLAGDCYDEIAGGYLCHLCKDESCETGEQTFKILLKEKDSIDIINDTTGLTGEDESGATDELPSGGEHGAFALARTAYSVCED